MSGIDAGELHYLSTIFEDHMAHPEFDVQPDEAEYIRIKLTRMGLDLNANATYELIKDGLTRKKFDDQEFLTVTYAVTAHFLHSQSLSGPGARETGAALKRDAIKETIETLDKYKAILERGSMPADADPIHSEIFTIILNKYKSGALHEYCDDLAVGHAAESYKNLLKSWERMTADLNELGRTPGPIWSPLENFKKIKELVDGMTPERQEKFYKEAGISEQGLKGLHREIALVVARESIKGKEAPENDSRWGYYRDECHRYAEHELKAAGVDMNSDATYAAIGVDKQTFRDNLQKETASGGELQRRIVGPRR